MTEKVHPDVHFKDCRQLVAILDQVILPFEHLWDKDVLRRKLYGKPGAFRPKAYGCEYRVLSNAWVDKPKVAAWLFDVVNACVKHLMKEKMAVDLMEHKEEWHQTSVSHRRIINFGFLSKRFEAPDEEKMILFRENLGTILDLETPDGEEDFV